MACRPAAATGLRRAARSGLALAVTFGAGGCSAAGRQATASPSASTFAATPPPVASAPARPSQAVAARSHRVVVRSPQVRSASFRLFATVAGQPAAWIASRGGATLLRFDQRYAQLALHAGTLDPGTGPYLQGPKITGSELHRALAAFNGGFRLNTASGGYLENGRAAKPLVDGFGSIVIYRHGPADIGAWHHGVPAARRRVSSVRQNLVLLVSRGRSASNVTSCALACWGATFGQVTDIARSGLGITSAGDLVWAAGVHLSPAGLADALIGAGAVRAVELDINPEWVAGYLYLHVGAAKPTPAPVLPGQFGVPGRFLTPYTRDFFAVFGR